MILQTKKIKGLHENDFIMAAKISEIANRIALGGDGAKAQSETKLLRAGRSG